MLYKEQYNNIVYIAQNIYLFKGGQKLCQKNTVL